MHSQKLMKNTVKILAWDRLWKNIVVNGEMNIGKRRDEVLGPEVDYT